MLIDRSDYAPYGRVLPASSSNWRRLPRLASSHGKARPCVVAPSQFVLVQTAAAAGHLRSVNELKRGATD